MSNSPTKIPCPNCKVEQVWSNDNPWRPFCSEQCKNHDFVAWANEEHVIGGNSLFDDLMSEDMPEGMDPNL